MVKRAAGEPKPESEKTIVERRPAETLTFLVGKVLSLLAYFDVAPFLSDPIFVGLVIDLTTSLPIIVTFYVDWRKKQAKTQAAT